ncbi:MAG: DNA-3-methyladenine glycosylase 2 family protein [Pseudomonadales bacterium]|nr:DNA-3-methyladenine glycosylase 2 family protein [Pseudomonadales bacterium]
MAGPVTDREIYEQAMLARDARFDGRFFIGVRTTGVYCRPVCKVKSPKLANVTFFPTAAAAAEAGFRPCLRCRPESSPGTPAWAGTSTTVQRGLRLIAEGALDDGSIEALSDRLGVTSRHLSRLFMQHLGASPKSVAQTRRLHFAKKLLNETSLSMTEIAMSAGYGSVRRFNDHIRSVYGRSPSMLRRKATTTASTLCLRLPYRPPYDYEAILAFLAVRATPGVESVEGGRYRRSIEMEGERGTISVEKSPADYYLLCEITLPGARPLIGIVERIRRLFDLNADPMEIECSLSRDPELASIVRTSPGRRVPGAWDPFEVAVRAIVGQQVSVKGATTVMGKIVQRYGEATDSDVFFPTPESLSRLEVDQLPMPRARALAIQSMAKAVCTGEIDFDRDDSAGMVASLMRIKGIGPWTAQYVAMRAAGDPDAFLHGDLVLRQVAAAKLGIMTEKALVERSQCWRPWRAYAGMHLWSLADKLKEQ